MRRRTAWALAVIGSAVAAAPARAASVATVEYDRVLDGTYMIQAHQPPGPGAGLPPLFVGVGSANNPREHRIRLLPGASAQRPLVEWRIREQGLSFGSVFRTVEYYRYFLLPAADFRPGGAPVRCLGENPDRAVETAQNGTPMDLLACPRRNEGARGWLLENNSWAYKLGFAPARLSQGWKLLGAYGTIGGPGAHAYCLEVRNASYTPFTALHLWSCRTVWNQRFVIRRVP